MKYFRCNKSDTKNIWKGIKQLVALKPKAYTTPTKIVTSSNTVLTKASDIANAFNHYFVNVGKSLSQTIPKVDVSFSSFLFNPLPRRCFLSPMSVQEIQDTISLQAGKASGPFSIPVSLLKSLNSIIGKPLEILHNLSFSSGTVPDSFKMACVIPVYKSGSSSSLPNYRPISLHWGLYRSGSR